jgi:ankyrin repeat protein
MARRMLAAGANVNHTNEDGETALIFAVRRSDLALARFLISAGGDVNVRSRWGVSALSVVPPPERRTNEDRELHKLLVEKKAVP